MSLTKENLYQEEIKKNEELDLEYQIQKQFPPSIINNSRAIIRRKLQSMNEYPSERKAQELERMVDGVSIDYQDSDVEEPNK